MKESVLPDRWRKLEGRKNYYSLHERNEKYAMWTLPYLYPREEQQNEELDVSGDSVGARLVNHLSNKIVETMFPSYRPFMKLEIDDEVFTKMRSRGVPLDAIDTALVRGERKAVRQLDDMNHRSAAVLAVKYLIVTGNTLMYYPQGGMCRVYNTRNYSVVRDVSGNVIEIMTRDIKAFETFKPDVQDMIRVHQDKHMSSDDAKNVTLYTQIKLEDDGKFHIKQAADKVDLDIPYNSYSRADLEWIPLSWNLVPGEDYAHGMVEDYRRAFNAVDVLSQSLLEGVITAATLKFLVNPASNVDIAAINSSRNGTFHSGRDGDITAIKSDKHLDFANVRQVQEDYQRQLGQAFLLGSETTRDAERVTAEEIRQDAQALDLSFGGIYSRFTSDWQKPVAGLLMARQDIKISDNTIYPRIVTGLETLSRMGDMDNFRMFMQDMSMLNGLPETVLQRLKIGNTMTFVGNNRGVDYSKFIMSEDEFQQQQQLAMQQQQAMMQQQMEAQVATEAGKAAVNNI